MEKVINVLYEIEEKANRILERTTHEKTRLYDQLNKDLEALEDSIKADTDQKLSILQSNMEKEILAERLALFDDCNKQLKAMDDNYLNNYNALVDRVFQRIIQV